jgi:hypothetical protein
MDRTLEAARLRIGDVELIVVFGDAGCSYDRVRECAVRSGLAGDVVLVWRNAEGCTQFIAPAHQHPFFRVLSYEQLHAQVNCTVTLPE